MASTVLQPSLHGLDEFVDIVLDEAESYGVDVSDIRKDIEELGYSDDDSEILSAIDRVEAQGQTVHYENDCFVVHDENDDCDACAELDIENGAYTTEDFRTFHIPSAHVTFTVPEDETWQAHLKGIMDDRQYWPDVYQISDHGNIRKVTAEEWNEG